MGGIESKVFCIGLSKTGTTSLARALELLGYKTKDYLGVQDYTPGDLTSIDLKEIDENDAFTDTPIPSFYRELDIAYPGSKFILTTRDMEGWLKSCKKQFTEKQGENQTDAQRRLLIDLYECNVFDEHKFRAGYEKFVNGVWKYFESRPDDLLVFDVSAGDGWDKLASFLGKALPNVPFPKANVTRIRWMDPMRVVKLTRAACNDAARVYRLLRGGKSPEKSISGSSRALAHVAKHALHLFKGKSPVASTIAERVFLQQISSQMTALSPETPLVYESISEQLPFSRRKNWNHLWLVDFQCFAHMPPGTEIGCVASLALIEDGHPILGVIYAPDINMTYYGMVGKGAFKICRNDEPEVLTADKTNRAVEQIQRQNRGMPCKTNPQFLNYDGCASLAICVEAEWGPDSAWVLHDSFEWETAAANVVVSLMGKKLVNCKSGSELIYN
jgi:3'-phosphoadenosine 5'-phosphosulfate (PAPS) 3'-phosphatase